MARASLQWRFEPAARPLRRNLDALEVSSEGKEGATTNDLFAFLTTEPNAIVAPIHAKAMRVILTSPAEVDRWLTATTSATPSARFRRPTGL